MGRPITREVKLKNGFYIEVRQKGSNRGIKIRRESYTQIQLAIKRYESMYSVKYIGEIKNGKAVD